MELHKTAIRRQRSASSWQTDHKWLLWRRRKLVYPSHDILSNVASDPFFVVEDVEAHIVRHQKLRFVLGMPTLESRTAAAGPDPFG